MPSHGSLTKSGKDSKLHEGYRRFYLKRGKRFRKKGRTPPRMRRRKQFQA